MKKREERGERTEGQAEREREGERDKRDGVWGQETLKATQGEVA